MEHHSTPGHPEHSQTPDQLLYESVMIDIDTVVDVVTDMLSTLRPGFRERSFRAERAGMLGVLGSRLAMSLNQAVDHGAMLEAYRKLPGCQIEIVSLRAKAYQDSGIIDKRTLIRESWDRSSQQAADFYQLRPRLDATVSKMQQALRTERLLLGNINTLDPALRGNVESEMAIVDPGQSEGADSILHLIERNIRAASQGNKTPLRFALRNVEWLVAETMRLDAEILGGEMFRETAQETEKLRQQWAQLSMSK